MSDVILYQGEPNSGDIRLRVWLSTLIGIVGVAASPVVGASQIDVTVAISGVASSAAVGTASVTVTTPITGVAATPSVGSLARFDVSDSLLGVLGSAGIGVGEFNSNVAISGVVSSATIGVTQIDVQGLLAGVAASPAIGTGTIIEDVIVTAPGVSATPTIGVGAFDSDFSVSGVVAGANIGTMQIDVQALLNGVSSSAAIGTGTVITGGDVIVDLIGVEASAAIGTGTVLTGADVNVDLVGVTSDATVGDGTVTIARRSIGIGEPIRMRPRVPKPKTLFIQPIPFDVTCSLKGIASTPQVGTPGLVIDSLVSTIGVTATPTVGEISGEATIEIQGLVANPGISVGSVSVESELFHVEQSPKFTVIDGRSMVNVTVAAVAPVPIVAVGESTIKIAAELLDEEILALLDAA